MTPLVDFAWTQFWQVTAVAAGVGLFIRLCCRRRPHLAHVLWLVVLVKCVTPPFWSSPTSAFSWATRHSTTAMSSIGVPLDTGNGPAPKPEPPLATHQGISGGGELPSSAVFRDAGSALADASSEVAPKPEAGFTHLRFELMLGVLWLIGASAYAAYAFLISIHFCRTIRTSRMPAEERLTRLAAELSRRLGIRRAVRFCVTHEPLGPLTFGWVRPMIVLPEALAAHRSLGELEPLVAHELVHVRRGDSFVGLLQATVQCLWWFHPLIWWANRRIAFERERCCDEEVVAGLALEPARYARSLVSVLELKRQLRWLSAAPGARPFEITQRRLEHIMLRGDRFRSRMPRGYWLALFVVALLLVPGAGLPDSSQTVESSPRERQSNRLLEPEATKETTRFNHAAPADDKLNPAEAEMHVVGVSMPKNGVGKDSGRVDVEVRPTAKPVVLVLTSYSSVIWNIKLADGARIKKAIVSGYFEQEIKGIPADVPIVNRSYFPADGSRRKEGWFWASVWNTPQCREMVRRLNDMTGLPVASFQAKSEGEAFIVDGNLGREQGQNGLKLDSTARLEMTPQDLLATSANAELHVAGIYFPDMHNPGQPVEVDVQSTTRPVVLVLTSYSEAVWHFKSAPGTRIKAVIIGSPSPQEVDGVPANVPVYRCCPDATSHFFDRKGPESDKQTFFAYQSNTLEYRRMVERLNDLTGLLVTTFQGAYSGTSFVIDGSRGRNFAQTERKPPRTVPKELKPEELLAASAQADLHLVGIYDSGAGNGAPVDIDVRPASKPIVLALASYGSVLWNVKIAEGARVQAVIVGGYYDQEIAGIPSNIPVVYRAFFPSRKEGYFYGYKWNTLEYRRMVESLNDMTGRLVSTFQGANSANSFVVDGSRGRNFAQIERKPRPTLPKEVKPEELLAASAHADLHVVGIYDAGAGNGAPVDVEVRPTTKPIVLALASYSSVLWNVRIAKDAQVKAVIVGGYFEQEIEGIPANVPIAYRAFFPNRNEGYYWGFDLNTKECQSMLEKLNDMTGEPVSTFQGEYTGTSFVVDGTRGRQIAQNERKVDGTRSREIAKNPPKQAESPSSDVADIPSLELQAAGDANKRFFLIGPKKNTKPPAEGYGLLVMMPGGDGSADFHPFVKRIYENALSDRYLAAQPIAVQWAKNQQIVWPTKTNPVAKMKFGTEEFVEAVIEDVAKKHKLDRTRVFSLSWSSSGPAAYATSLQNKRSVVGSFIAMSVFNPKFLPALTEAKGHAYYLYHSQEDRVCPFRMAEQAKNSLSENKAKVRLETYDGGHGWRGNVYQDIRNGIEWLEKNREKASRP
jgi:beta-lactamase regulating signal transducer with metallopeptidase domain/predicted esterase